MPVLTGLRFFLAAWVLLHHLSGRGRMLDAGLHALPPAFGSIVRAGYLAVSTFFMLSGFVLARRYLVRGWTRESLTAYGVARLARVLPLYALSLVIVAPFIAADAFPPSGERATALASYALLLQGWTGRLGYGWNTPAWSLSCEMFFYLCFPLAAVWLGGMGRRSALFLGALTCVLPQAMLRAGVPYMWKPLLHMADFLMGIAAARAYDLLVASGKAWKGRGHWFYAPGALGALTLILWPQMLGGLLTVNDALRPLNALLLVGLALDGGWLAAALAAPVTVYLGQASYAMYILHIPLLWWYSRLRPHFLAWLPSTACALLYAAGVVAVSAAVFRFFEAPVNQRIRAWARGERGTTG
ncbi:MAG TPA: acyltransferase [Bryobacteraceae bacterium]|nr:acyltransferase [Bryobacteraceae bacterium]